jgi:hypothetical protein
MADQKPSDALTPSTWPVALDDVDFNHSEPKNNAQHFGWRFWLIIVSLCAISLLTAVEGTVTATALPTIAHELDSRELYVWFVNAIFLSR